MSKKAKKHEISAEQKEILLALKKEEQSLKEISAKIKALKSKIKDDEDNLVELYGYVNSDSSTEETKAYAKAQTRVLRESGYADRRELKKLSEERLLYKEKISSIHAEIAKSKSMGDGVGSP